MPREYIPQVGDKITTGNTSGQLHVTVTKIFDNPTHFEADGFRGDNESCRPFQAEMTVSEVGNILTHRSGRIYREDESGEMTIVLSARNGRLH